MDKKFSQNNFDLLRLFGATQVLIFHSVYHLNLHRPDWFNVFGALAGVPMFFTISGFLISASYERTTDLKNYFKNRCFRIYPGLWSCIFLNIIVISIVGHISFFNKQTIPWLVGQMTGMIHYTPGFLKGYGTGSYDGSLWTIPIELQFYILLPIIYLIFQRITKSEKTRNILFCILCFIFLITAYVLIRTNIVPITITKNQPIITKILQGIFVPYFYMFLFGVVLQRLKVNKYKFIAGKGFFWLPIFLLLVVLCPSTPIFYVLRMVFLGVTTISLAYTKPDFSKKVLKGNDVSYGVYIYHLIVVNILVEKFATHNYFQLGVVIVITFIIAALSWRYIEKPILRRKKQTLNIALADTPPVQSSTLEQIRV
jgi:peptidoglycan/LPS O-acetylase OafA/YrhL